MAARNEYGLDLNCEDVRPVKRTNIMTRLLIKERKSVLFVGEGDFSFTVAFATLREYEKNRQTSTSNPGIWDGIISTRYERVSRHYPLPDFSHVIESCKSEFRSERLKCSKWDDETSKQFRTFDRIIPPGQHQSWQCGVDATRYIRSIANFNPDVVWFQCPWDTSCESVFPLIHTFLINMWKQIEPGKYVCIGITRNERYVERYELQNILGFWDHRRFQSTDVLDNYDFCGADQKLVRGILQFGYHHQGSTDIDIHDLIKDDHVTLVFQKKRQGYSRRSGYSRY